MTEEEFKELQAASGDIEPEEDENEPEKPLKNPSESKPEKTAPKQYLANFKGLIDLCTDAKGFVVFLIKTDGEPIIQYNWTINGKKVYPPPIELLPFKLPRSVSVVDLIVNEGKLIHRLKTPATTDYSECGESSECNYNTGGGNLLNEVINYLKRHSYLPEGQFLVIALSVFLTYLQDHPNIDYLPMILFYAVPERGKSRTGKAVTLISYRGVHCVDLREANLFRYTQNLRATLFIDVMDVWQKAERNQSEDILLLRYEKGAKAARVIHPERGAFRDTTFYDVFGSTYLASNEPVHEILDTRCIGITMPNKPGRYENPCYEKAQGLKERLTAWRALVMDRPLPTIEPIEGIQGRLWDICNPLLSVCRLIAPERYSELINELLGIAGQRVASNKDSFEGEIVEALYALSIDKYSDEWTLKTSDVTNKINEKRPEGCKVDSRYIGKKVKALGLRTSLKQGGRSHIELEKDSFGILCLQHGITEKGQGEPAPCNHSLHSPHSLEPVVARVLSGECSSERAKKDPSHPPKMKENVANEPNSEPSWKPVSPIVTEPAKDDEIEEGFKL